MTNNQFSRRAFGAGLLGGAALVVLPMPALALDVNSARALIDKAIGAVNRVISSGKSVSSASASASSAASTPVTVPQLCSNACISE